MDAPDFTDAHDPHRREGSANPGAPHTTVSDALGAQILLIEDDPALRTVIAAALERAGHRITAVGDGVSGMEELRSERHEIVLLDLGLPLISGWEILESLPQPTRRSVIVISASGDDQAKVWALDLGADDYLTKPFGVDELLARVRAVLRRAQFAANEHAHVLQTSIGDLVVDYTQHLVTMAGQEVPLTPIEYRLLAYLAQNAGRVVTQDLLLEHVWGSEYPGESHMLQVNINRLRRKIETDPTHPRYILTKVGIGYLLATQPEVHAAE